jgi:hypothetical protein
MCREVEEILDDVEDAVDDVVDFVEDIIDDTLDFLFGWLIPDMPDMPNLDALLAGDGILVNKRNSDTALPVIYGTRKVGGNIVWLATSTDNQFLYVILALCEGQVARFTELFIDDELYATFTGSDSTFGTSTVIESMSLNGVSTTAPTNTSNLSIETSHPAYQGTEEVDGVETTHYLTNFRFFNGTDGGHHYGSGVSSFSTPSSISDLGWDATHLGKGICHAAFRFKYNSDAFNRIPKINFVLRGKLVNTNLSGTSMAFSANPALCLHDYLISTRYGKGLSASDIDTTAFTAAQNVCDTSVVTHVRGGINADATKLFECHVALGNKTKLIDNVKTLISSMRGFFTYSGGLYTLKIEGTGSSVLTITEDMMIGGLKIIGEEKAKKYNRVIARFDNEEKAYQKDEIIYPPIDETNVGSDFKYATMLSSDNNEELHFDMSLPATTSPYQAEDLAELALKRSRTGLRIALKTTSEALNLIVGDIFAVTHTGFGFNSKLFICNGLTLDKSGFVAVRGLEYDASVYTYNTKIQTPDAPTTFLPNPKVVNAPTITSVTDELINVTEGNINVIMTVTLRGTPDFFVDKFEVVYKKSTETIYKTSGISSATVRQIPVESGATYNVRARAINSLGYKSAFVTEDHFVVGASDPPANVSDLSIDFQDQLAVLEWTPSTDLDLSHYFIRYTPVTSSASYINTTLLVDKISPPANSVIVPAKAGTYFIKAVDLLGHESVTATSVIGTISTFAGQNLQLTLTEETSFAGTKTDVAVTDGALFLQGQEVTSFDSVSGDFDDQGGFFDEVDGFETSGNYLFANQFSLPAKYQGRVSSVLNVDRIDRVSNFDDAGGLFDSAQGNFDDASSAPQMNAKLLIATSDDNSTFTAFTPFQDGNYEFRYAKFKLELTSDVSHQSPKVNNCQVKLFMMERTDRQQNIVSGTSTSGKAVTFGTAFYAEPSVTISAQNLATGDFFTITSKSATGFTIEFFNSSGSTISRTFDYVANGQGRAI